MNPRPFSDPFFAHVCSFLLVMFCYGMPEMAANVPFDDKERFVRDYLRPALVELDAFLSGAKFIAGDELSFVDFQLWEMLDVLHKFDAEIMTELNNLNKFKMNFENIPRIQDYVSSPRFI